MAAGDKLGVVMQSDIEQTPSDSTTKVVSSSGVKTALGYVREATRLTEALSITDNIETFNTVNWVGQHALNSHTAGSFFLVKAPALTTGNEFCYTLLQAAADISPGNPIIPAAEPLHPDFNCLYTSVGGELENLDNRMKQKASKASPTFTGTPTAPTAESGTNTTQIATTAFVQGEIETMLAPAFDPTAQYTAGSYCTYSGKLYRFTSNHQGAWVAGDVTAVSVGDELNNRMIEDVDNPGCFYRWVVDNGAATKEWWNPPLQNGVYRTTKKWGNNPVYVKKGTYSPSNPISISDLSYITIGTITSTDGVTAASKVVSALANVVVTVNGAAYNISLPYFGSDIVTGGVSIYKTQSGTTHNIRLCFQLLSGITATLIDCDYAIEFIK